MTLRKRFACAVVCAVTGLFASLTGAAASHADHTITLTFIRSAQSAGNATGLIDTSVPGPDLSQVGYQQAATLAKQLRTNGYDGIYASTMVRAQQSAAPLSQALGKPVTVLPGLREIEAGQFEGQPEADAPQDEAAAMAWLTGDRGANIPGSVNGDEFSARFGEAVQTIYDSGNLNPVAFSHSGAMMFWVLMNVKNPDSSLPTSHPIPNTGRIVVVGSPQGGWTLTNWGGMPLTAT
jgi:broad specificity phosphatase PhoE